MSNKSASYFGVDDLIAPDYFFFETIQFVISMKSVKSVKSMKFMKYMSSMKSM